MSMASPGDQIEVHAKAGAQYVPFLRRMMTKAIRQHPGPGLLSIALVGDAKMSLLHRQFLKIDGPTDVLTFEIEHDAKGRVTHGEVIVCVPEARRQAKRHGTKVEHELLLYCVHGLLHLTGHDDLDEAGHRKMHRAEDRILTAIGIGPVFHMSPHSKRKKATGRRS